MAGVRPPQGCTRGVRVRIRIQVGIVIKDAIISKCGNYRYLLSRHWGAHEHPQAAFIMLNPSIADALVDDATIRKCIGFAKRWDMHGIYVGNLFAFRATNPRDMKAVHDPAGPDNHRYLFWMCKHMIKNGGVVVCAWGAGGSFKNKGRAVLSGLEQWSVQPKALGLTRAGFPKHPLYVPYDAALITLTT